MRVLWKYSLVLQGSGIAGPLVLCSQCPFLGLFLLQRCDLGVGSGLSPAVPALVTLSTVHTQLPRGSRPLGAAALGSPSSCPSSCPCGRRSARPYHPTSPHRPAGPMGAPTSGRSPTPCQLPNLHPQPGERPLPGLYAPWAPELLCGVGGWGLPGSAAPADVTPGRWDLPACSARGHK